MKRCPTCKKTFTEEHLSFCVEDGTPLVTIDAPDDEATVVRFAPEDGATGSSPSSGTSGERDSPAYQPPGSYVPSGSYRESKRRTWPWILGILGIVFVVFAGLGIAAAVLIPRLMRASSNNTNLNANVEKRSSNPNANANSGNSNSNRNSNSNSANWNENKSAVEDTAPPPTDEVEVLSDLTDLEHEWTVANINAETITNLAPEFKRILKPGGRVILCGIPIRHADRVTACMETYGLPVTHQEEGDIWVRLIC